MAVGASQPTVVASKDGLIGMQNQMQVTIFFLMMNCPDVFISNKNGERKHIFFCSFIG